MFDAGHKTIRRAVRVTPALAARFDLAARIRGRTPSDALRDAMEAYAAATAGRNDERPGGRGAVVGAVEEHQGVGA